MAIFQECRTRAPYRPALWRFHWDHIKPEHFHGQLELMVVRKGTARLRLGTLDMDVGPLDAIWVLPQQNHMTSGFSEDFDMWVVQMEPEYVQRIPMPFVEHDEPMPEDSPFLGWLTRFSAAVAHAPVGRLDEATFASLDEQCHEAWDAADMDDRDRFLAQAVETAWSHTIRQLPESMERLSISHRAIALVASDLDLVEQELCEILGVSAGYLIRCLQKDLGCGFVEHRSRARVASCLAFLRREDWSLMRAALAAGFGSYSQFYRTFVKVTGWTPKEYVKQNGRNEIAEITASQMEIAE